MPYDSINELPEQVRNALPAEAQRVWMAAYNAATEEDEGARAAIAWSAVQNAGWEKENDQWVKKQKVQKASGEALWAFHAVTMQVLPKEVTDKLHELTGAMLLHGPEVLQGQLTPGDVHVQAPLEIDLDDLSTQIMAAMQKRQKADDIDEEPVQKSLTATFIKADNEQQLVTGIVLEPETVDAQGDIISAEVIEKAAHNFLAKSRIIGKQHKGKAMAEVVESYIAPRDMQIGEQGVKKGSWIMSVKVHDNSLWEEVKAGEITGFSIGALGVREQVA
jgi:cation transport regulator ChaB